jgi:hypothetical protein
MGNVQKLSNCIYIPSSQTSRAYSYTRIFSSRNCSAYYFTGSFLCTVFSTLVEIDSSLQILHCTDFSHHTLQYLKLHTYNKLQNFRETEILNAYVIIHGVYAPCVTVVAKEVNTCSVRQVPNRAPAQSNADSRHKCAIISCGLISQISSSKRITYCRVLTKHLLTLSVSYQTSFITK